MPRTLSEALAGLEDDVRQVRLTPAAAVRARGRRRTLRRRAGATASALALVGAATLLPFGSGPRPVQPAAPVCAGPVDLSVPDSLEGVRLRVADATGRAEAGREVVAELRQRGFALAEEGGTLVPLPNAAVGTIRYGPGAVGDAAMVRAVFSDRADPIFEPARSDDLIDIVMGPAYRQLGTPTEINLRLVHVRPEDLPHAC